MWGCVGWRGRTPAIVMLNAVKHLKVNRREADDVGLARCHAVRRSGDSSLGRACFHPLAQGVRVQRIPPGRLRTESNPEFC